MKFISWLYAIILAIATILSLVFGLFLLYIMIRLGFIAVEWLGSLV